MKREVFCEPCLVKTAHILNGPTDPGEFVNVVQGPSKNNIRCDFCGAPIAQGAPIGCVTFGIGEKPEHIIWHSEFIGPVRTHPQAGPLYI